MDNQELFIRTSVNDVGEPHNTWDIELYHLSALPRSHSGIPNARCEAVPPHRPWWKRRRKWSQQYKTLSRWGIKSGSSPFTLGINMPIIWCANNNVPCGGCQYLLVSEDTKHWHQGPRCQLHFITVCKCYVTCTCRVRNNTKAHGINDPDCLESHALSI